MSESYGGGEINTVLTVVERMSTNGDVQLSILAHALVIACKSTQVDRETALAEIGKLWDRDDPLVHLRQTTSTRPLAWPLPESFNPDGGVSFEPVGNKETPHEYRLRPTGTNVLDFVQATAMVRHMVGLPEFDADACPGHVPDAEDPKVCGRCGTDIDSLRPEPDDSQPSRPMRLIERTRRALDGAAKPFGYRICYAADTDRALDIVPARDILKCDGCGQEFHRDWGEFCPDCSGAS